MARYTDPGHIPGPVYIPAVVAVRLMWRLTNGKQANNILHASYVTPPVIDTAFVNALFTSLTTGAGPVALLALISSQVKLEAVGVRNMANSGTPGTGYGEVISSSTPVAGTDAASDPLPATVSAVVSLKTGFSGQANRGRIYFTGFTEASNTSAGKINGALNTALVGYVTAIDAAFDSRSLTFCIAHPARQAYTGSAGAEHPARAAGNVAVTSWNTLNTEWDTTRLRKLH